MADPEPKAALFLALAAMNVAAVGMYWYAKSTKGNKTLHMACTLCSGCKKLLGKSTKATSTSEHLYRATRVKFAGLLKTARKHGRKRRSQVKFFVGSEETKPAIVVNQRIPSEGDAVADKQHEPGVNGEDIGAVNGIIQEPPPKAQKENELQLSLRTVLLNTYSGTTKSFPTSGPLQVPDALQLETPDTFTQVMVDSLVTTICSKAEEIRESQKHLCQKQIPPMVSQSVYNTVVLYNNITPKGINPTVKNLNPDLQDSVLPRAAEEDTSCSHLLICDENDEPAACLAASSIPGSDVPIREIEEGQKTDHDPIKLGTELPDTQNEKASSLEDSTTRACDLENDELERTDHLFSAVLDLLESWNKRKPYPKSSQSMQLNLEKQENVLVVQDLLDDFISSLELDSKNCPIKSTVDCGLLSVGDSSTSEIRPLSSGDRQYVIWGQKSAEKGEKDSEKLCPYLFFDSGAREILETAEEKISLKKYASQESIHSCEESFTEGEFYECDLASQVDSKVDLQSDTISVESFSRLDNDDYWNESVGRRNNQDLTPSTDGQQLLEFFGPESPPLAFFEEVAKEYQEKQTD
ncbi:Hypothetical protein NTJ_00657 [Nesidiocoris tenuis]|uniref:BED-type domain-containing protein n=1 Tax=Nesidiocoris tenuis TaxID=355587 RepID=A0ABN7A6L7_9HEMI|nr:Hypothetical protein NTJ_00657 [Nesidiocoris tenuis]